MRGAYRGRVRDEHSHDLARPSQRQQAEAHDEGAADHERSSPSPFRGGSVRQVADDRLRDEPAQGTGNPDQRGPRLGQSELKKIRRAI